MAPKRPPGDEINGRQRKKLKTQAAREIDVQHSVRKSQKVRIDALNGLPSTIDVDKFVEARGFEIQAMEKAIKTAGDASSHRVWQTLPRHLRRRAASHDVRRVPERLRGKARAEMDPPKAKKGKKPPKRGKTKTLSKTVAFQRRQHDKTWLESHIWHAKRMHMENLWGYRIAIKTTEKAFRPSFRAATRGCILHDASYIGTIQLKGREEHIKAMLNICCDAQATSPGSVRYSRGARALETHIYRPNKYPFDLVAPATILWQPDGENNHDHRLVWLRVHPGAFDTVFAVLTEASSLVMSGLGNDEESQHELELSDLRGHLNEFELMGPASGKVLCKALSRVTSEDRREVVQFWQNLQGDGSSSASAQGIICGVVVHDPRIKGGRQNSQPGIATPFVKPDPILAKSSIWSQTTRTALAHPQYAKADIDKRRGQAAANGLQFHPGPDDDRIPVILVQRSLAPTSPSPSIHGWSLIFPHGWSMAFLSALTHSSIRVAGLRDCQTQSFESGVPTFPNDHPGTGLYDLYTQERAKAERARWERTPPAKRANYREPGNLDPWTPQWGTAPVRCDEEIGESLLPAQRDDEEPPRLNVWIFRGPSSVEILDVMANSGSPEMVLLAWINGARSQRDMIKHSIEAQSAYETALVPVEVTMLARGVLENSSRVYALSDSEFSECQASSSEMENNGAMSDNRGTEILPIGYITTGAYSLSRGRGYGLGYISIEEAVRLVRQRNRLQAAKMFVCIRNKREGTYWAGRLSFIS